MASYVYLSLPELNGKQTYMIKTNKRHFFVLSDDRSKAIRDAELQLNSGEMVEEIWGTIPVIES